MHRLSLEISQANALCTVYVCKSLVCRRPQLQLTIEGKTCKALQTIFFVFHPSRFQQSPFISVFENDYMRKISFLKSGYCVNFDVGFYSHFYYKKHKQRIAQAVFITHVT